jgi:hypothetical protein
MKIEQGNTEKVMTFDNLSSGDVFSFRGSKHVHVKSFDSHDYYDLSNNIELEHDENKPVILHPNATLILEP